MSNKKKIIDVIAKLDNKRVRQNKRNGVDIYCSGYWIPTATRDGRITIDEEFLQENLKKVLDLFSKSGEKENS